MGDGTLHAGTESKDLESFFKMDMNTQEVKDKMDAMGGKVVIVEVNMKDVKDKMENMEEMMSKMMSMLAKLE